MKKVFCLNLVLVFVLSLAACSDSSIDLVKKSNFRDYPNVTIGKLFDSRFDSPKWSAKENSRGEKIVAFEGKISKSLHSHVTARLFNLILNDGIRGRRPDKAITADDATRIAEHTPFLVGYDRIPKDHFLSRQSECWNAGTTPAGSECRQKLLQEVYDALARTNWVVGDTVFFEWAIHSNGKNFDLARFGAGTIGSISLKNFLAEIYDAE